MSFMTEYGASHLFVRAFHLVPVIVLRLFTVSVSYGSVIMSLPFLSLMEVSPIGWSGSCSRMSSWLISIFHDFAKSMAVLRWGSGIRHTLFSLSQRACGIPLLSALTSSGLYGVSNTRCVPSKRSCFIAFYGAFLSFVRNELYVTGMWSHRKHSIADE